MYISDQHATLRRSGESPAWTSIYYIKLADTQGMKCTLCDFVLEVDGKSMELLNHMKEFHQDIYNLHKANPEANVGFRIEFLQVSVLNDEINPKTTPILLEEVCETNEPPKEIELPVINEDDVINTQYVIDKKKKKRKSENSEARKRSWVWKYFDKLSNIIFRCNLCNVVLSIKGCNTNNMNRHVRTRHPQIYRKEVSKRVTCDNADIGSDIDTPYAIKTEEIYASDHKDVDLDDVAESPSQKLRRSWIWSYFSRVTSTQAQCKLCSRQISHGGNATGNMNRHLKMIHNKTAEYSEIEKGKTKWIWKVFEECEDDAYSCKICQFRCEKGGDEISNVTSILSHLKVVHGVVSGDQIITGPDCERDEDED